MMIHDREVVTLNYNTRHPFVTQRELVNHVAGGRWAVGSWVGGCGWVVRLCGCVCGLRFVVGVSVGGRWWVVGGWWLGGGCVLCVAISNCAYG